MIRARIDPALKDRAETILNKLGSNPGDAIRLFHTRITLAEGLPFPVKVPDAETIQAMKVADAGEGIRSTSVAETFEKLGISSGQAEAPEVRILTSRGRSGSPRFS